MMNLYTPRRVRALKLAAMGLRSFAMVLQLWPLLFALAIVLSPITPHVLWTYTYHQHGSMREMISCDYIGVRGRVRYREGTQCPYITLIDLREYGR